MTASSRVRGFASSLARRPWLLVPLALIGILGSAAPFTSGGDRGTGGTATPTVDVPGWCVGPEVSAVALESAPAADVARCDLRGRTIRYRDVAVTVPEPGTGVAASAVTVDGEQELVVDSATDGSVRVQAHHALAGLPAATSTASAACRDGAYSRTGFRIRPNEAYKWYYNPNGVPTSVRSSAESAIVAATNTAFSGRNACGHPADLRISHSYLGKSGRNAQIDSAGRCTGNDGWSITSWRRLDKALGYACTYYSVSSTAKYVVASDVAVNSSWTWFTTKPANCRGTDLQSVMVHERGHTLGLGHVDPRTHPGQVMTSTIPSCTYKRLLGLGDYRGLAHTYGHR